MPNARERIVIIEDGADLAPELVTREPANEVEVWRGCGAERGEYEDAVRASTAERTAEAATAADIWPHIVVEIA